MELYSKGQGATEYLVLLAVVLMIALVSIALLGFFPGLAGDAKKTQSDSYWKSARPFGVLEYTQTGVNLVLLVQNNDPDQRSITNHAFNAQTASNSTTVALNAGEKRTIAVQAATACTVGNIYEYYLNFTYSTTDLTGLKQIGTKPLLLKCAG